MRARPRRRVGWLLLAALVGASGCLSQGDSSRLQRQIQELKDEVYLLRRQREDTERRLSELEGRLGVPRAAAPAEARPVPRATPAPEPPSTAAFGARAAPPSTEPSRASAVDVSIYDEGMKAYASGDRALAIRRLADFLERNASDSRAPEAQFILAEAYYGEANFPQAIIEYQKVLDAHPDSPRVPAALYGIGLSYYELNYTSNAVAHLERLVKQYPNSPLAKEAKPLIERARRGKK